MSLFRALLLCMDARSYLCPTKGQTPNRALLADGNLPSRIWQIIGAALIASALSDVLIVAAIMAGYEHLRPWIISLFSVGNLLLIGIIGLSTHLQSEASTQDGPVRTATVEDQQVWQRLQQCMKDQKPYLDPDLTLARLSRKLGVPAKTLSIVINQETGANVSRYVNEARIIASQKALLAGENVTAAMLASGFNTKSNFNREFLRVTGQSPRIWLESFDPKTTVDGPR
ncbi:MAG: helix-turn-helix domain-containing protein [Roseobacter sp.]